MAGWNAILSLGGAALILLLSLKARRAVTGWRPGDRRADAASMLRVDQAGEYGATRIYAGQLAVLRPNCPEAKLIARMAAQERRHLARFDAAGGRAARPPDRAPAVVERRRLRARRGHRADVGESGAGLHRRDRDRDRRHYGEQLDALGGDDPELAADIAEFRAEEVEHRDTARAAGCDGRTAIRCSTRRSVPGAGWPSRFRSAYEELPAGLVR